MRRATGSNFVFSYYFWRRRRQKTNRIFRCRRRQTNIIPYSFYYTSRIVFVNGNFPYIINIGYKFPSVWDATISLKKRRDSFRRSYQLLLCLRGLLIIIIIINSFHALSRNFSPVLGKKVPKLGHISGFSDKNRRKKRQRAKGVVRSFVIV